MVQHRTLLSNNVNVNLLSPIDHKIHNGDHEMAYLIIVTPLSTADSLTPRLSTPGTEGSTDFINASFCHVSSFLKMSFYCCDCCCLLLFGSLVV